MFHRLCLAALLFVLNSTATAQAEILQPIRNWNIDYRDDQCLASRAYGKPEKPITLGLRPAPNGETYELLVELPHAGPGRTAELKGSVDFGNGPIQAWLLSYATSDGKSNLYQFRISAADMAQANAASTVTVKASGSPALTFALSSMPVLLKGLQSCTADLEAYWNEKGETDGRIAQAAKGDVRSVFSADDYPDVAVNLEQQGSTQFLLLIDEKGAVAGCHVLKPSGVPVLDAMGCQIIKKRTKLSPARDAQGKAVRSTMTTPPIVWRLE
jgi:hypothetical protein